LQLRGEESLPQQRTSTVTLDTTSWTIGPGALSISAAERYGGQRVPVEVANLSGGLGEASPPIKITLAGRWLARRKHAYELICTTDSQRIRIMRELSVVQI
jgi:hypothetical protein